MKMISAVLLFNSIVRYLVAFAMYKLTVSAKVIDITIYLQMMSYRSLVSSYLCELDNDWLMMLL